MENLSKFLRGCLRSKPPYTHQNHGFFGLGLDFGIVPLAISQSLSIKASSWQPSPGGGPEERLPKKDCEIVSNAFLKSKIIRPSPF